MSRSVSRTSTIPRPASSSVNTQTKVLDTVAGRILCIADIRGRISSINELAREADAKAVIHTGDFGFFENSSLERINDRTLRHLIQYSPLISTQQRNSLLLPENTAAFIRNAIATSTNPVLSEFPLLLAGSIKLSVPVYTVWGACEDVSVIEKFRSGQYDVMNLHILDEATTRCLDVGGVKFRLLGLGGALVPHKMFDNGEGQATIAGGQGTMWTTALQIGELVDTAQRVFDQTETRLLVTHASPGREGLIAQLGLVLKADLTISAGLHFRYASSYNEFSVHGDLEGYRHKLMVGKDAFDKVWENVKPQVDAVIDENQRILLDKALAVIERIPSSAPGSGPGPSSGEDSAWKNCWNWNLCDAANGSLVLDIRNGRVSAELKSQGFNYLYRRTATPSTAPTPQSITSSLPQAPTKASTPVPAASSSAQSSGTPANAEIPSVPSASVVQTTSQLESSNGGKINGTSPADSKEKEQFKKQKKEKERERKKEERERERAEREAASKDGGSERKGPPPPHQAKPSTSSTAPSQDADPLSPVEGGTGSGTGARTPTGPPRRRNHPWTLFMKLPGPCTETDIREFFLTAKDGITAVKFPQSNFGRARVVFVEFGDEEAMREGLNKHAEKLKDSVVNVTIADDRERPSERGGFGGRGRGGRGGFAQRAAAQAGLVRHSGGGNNGKKENGEAGSKPATIETPKDS